MTSDSPYTWRICCYGTPATSAVALSLRALGYVEWSWWACALAGPACLSAIGATLFVAWTSVRFVQWTLERWRDDHIGANALMALNAIAFFGAAAWMLAPHLGVPSGLLGWVWALPATMIVGCFVGTVSFLGLGGFVAGRLHPLDTHPAFERRRWRTVTFRITIAVYAGALAWDAASRVHGADWLWAAPAIVVVAVAGAIPTMGVVTACEKRKWGALAIGAIVIAAFAFVLAEIASPRMDEADWMMSIAPVTVVAGLGLGASALLGRMAWEFERSQTADEEQ